MKDYEDLYNGEVSFVQKNLDTKEICDIHYDHMYYEKIKSPIYPYHTKEKASVLFQQGISYTEYIPREIEMGSILYKYIRFIARLTGEEREYFVRFYQLHSFLGKTFSLHLLQRGMSEEEMDAFLQSKGFFTEIPSLLFDVYNENDVFLKMISEIVLLMKEINDKKEDTKRFIITKNE